MNDKNKIISYAYNGLIYLPLFFAYKRGYFPSDIFLAENPSGGDEEAINDLVNSSEKSSIDNTAIKGKTFISICDPLLTKNLMEKVDPNTREVNRTVVFGCLIDNLPIWCYSQNKNLKEATLINDFLKNINDSKIDELVYYKLPNTGGLIAHYLLEMYNKNKNYRRIGTTKAVEFNQEFGNTSNLIVTSDLLKINENSANGFIKFRFASNSTLDISLKYFFFTGLVTMEKNLKENLSCLLQIMNGLEKAVCELKDDYFRNSRINEIYNIMNKNLAEKYPSKTEPEKKEILTRSLDMLFKSDIYSENLEIDKTRWDNNIFYRRKYQEEYIAPEYRIFSEEIPVVLIKDGWRDELVKRKDELLIKKSDYKILDFFKKPSLIFWLTLIVALASLAFEYMMMSWISLTPNSTIFPPEVKYIITIILILLQIAAIACWILNYVFKRQFVPKYIILYIIYLIPSSFILGNILQ